MKVSAGVSKQRGLALLVGVEDGHLLLRVFGAGRVFVGMKIMLKWETENDMIFQMFFCGNGGPVIGRRRPQNNDS